MNSKQSWEIVERRDAQLMEHMDQCATCIENALCHEGEQLRHLAKQAVIDYDAIEHKEFYSHYPY